MSDVYQESLELHRKNKGKIQTTATVAVENYNDLSRVYSPGIAEVSRHIAGNPGSINALTSRGATVGIVTDGSAILGLGNLGPSAAYPVMEGKALLFKTFAGLNAVPLCLDVHDVESIVSVVKALEPSFAGINLEDIAAPQCFEIEKRLQAELSIPVMHDDQHGTAVVVLAGLINALALAGKQKEDAVIVLSGSGAAGTSIAELLHSYGFAHIIVCDSQGIISASRSDLNPSKQALLLYTNQDGVSGTLLDALKGADVFIGVSAPGVLEKDHIGAMNEKPIVFALANPTPEIMPDEARAFGAFVVATGRSDFPNQLNNALAFPGLFKGAIESSARGEVVQFSSNVFIRAAEKLASLVPEPSVEKIIPGIFEPGLADEVASAFSVE